MVSIPGIPPEFMWAVFLILVMLLLWLDLGVFMRHDHVIGIKESLLLTAFWIGLAMVFNAWVWFQFGPDVGLEFFTGYVIEKSLSMDNLFVFLLIFASFNVPRIYQHRVLFWGIIGAVVFRGIFIALGAALVSRFDWMFFFFGLILLYGAYRMQFSKNEKFNPKESIPVRIARFFVPVRERINGHDFFVRIKGKWHATILLLALVTIEMTDIVFATDSIPAIFAITTDPFIVFTSNIFAILGLRALYFAIAGLHAMFAYLKTGLAIILAYIAVKMFLMGIPSLFEALGLRAPWHEIHVPVHYSLIFILSVLVISIVASLILVPKAKHA